MLRRPQGLEDTSQGRAISYGTLPGPSVLLNQGSDTHSPLLTRAGVLGRPSARDSREPIYLSCLRVPHLLAAEGNRADTTTSIRHRPRRLPQEERTIRRPTRLPADSALQILCRGCWKVRSGSERLPAGLIFQICGCGCWSGRSCDLSGSRPAWPCKSPDLTGMLSNK